MTNVGKMLYDLQQIDLTLRKNNQRLGEIAAQLANHAPVRKAQKQVEHAESVLKPLEVALRDLELQVQSTKQKRESSEKRLYSGAVSNPKELQDIEQSIDSLKRWQSELEDKQLDLMLEIEVAQETLDTAQSNLEQVTQNAASSNQDLLQEQQTLKADLITLQSDRDTLSGDIPASMLALYDDMQPKTAYLPVALLTDDRTCSICGVQQTSLHVQEIRQNDELGRCANCNRILISDR